MKFLFFLNIFLAISCNTVINKPGIETESAPEIIQPGKGYTILTGSKSIKDVLCQCWENEEDWEEARQYGISSDIDMVLRGYCFYKDGTVVKYPRGYMETGTWELKDQAKPININLDFENGKESLTLAVLSPTKFKFKKDNKLEDYFGTALRRENEYDDPFYPVNNKWRLRPSHPETAVQIKKRVKGCIHFFIMLYNHEIETSAKTVLFAGYPSCFKWYAGGIYMQKENELQQKWIDCFYNRADAMKGYALAGKLMKLKYIWPKDENNWLKLNVAVLKQMEQKIDSLK